MRLFGVQLGIIKPQVETWHSSSFCSKSINLQCQQCFECLIYQPFVAAQGLDWSLDQTIVFEICHNSWRHQAMTWTSWTWLIDNGSLHILIQNNSLQNVVSKAASISVRPLSINNRPPLRMEYRHLTEIRGMKICFITVICQYFNDWWIAYNNME